MTNASSLFRSLLIYTICVPLAIFLGYLMATGTSGASWPLFDPTTSVVLGLLLFLLVLPLLLRWHHTWLIASWNFSLVAFFIPGKPLFWMVLAWLSAGIALGQYILNRKLKFLNVPSVTRPLIFLVLVVLITARCTGGIGMQVMGSDTFGGKRYLILLSAIIGFFAMTSQPIPPRRAWLYVALFFLGSATLAVGELLPLLPTSLYFIFLLFPVSSTRMGGDPIAGAPVISRLGGLAMAGSSIFIWMLCRYGIEQLFTWKRLGRLLVFLSAILLGLLGGFRGTLVTFLLTFAILFYLEGLMRSRLLPVLFILFLFVTAVVLPFSDRLPLNIQRTLSVLPVPIDPVARISAQASSQWRLEMWKNLLPQVPQYLILGKGYAFNPQDVAMLKVCIRLSKRRKAFRSSGIRRRWQRSRCRIISGFIKNFAV